MAEYQLDKIHEQHFVEFFRGLTGSESENFQMWVRTIARAGKDKPTLICAIVADNPDVLTTLSSELKEQHHITSSSNAQKAKSVAQRKGKKPEIRFTKWIEARVLVGLVEDFKTSQLGAEFKLQDAIDTWVESKFNGVSISNLADMSGVSDFGSEYDLAQEASPPTGLGVSSSTFQPAPPAQAAPPAQVGEPTEKTPLVVSRIQDSEADDSSCCCVLS